MSDQAETTEILLRAARGSAADADQLFPLAYDELRAIAGRHLSRERADHTLQPTELVHEVYGRLVDATRLDWNDRAHFLALASRAMRHVLVDHARRRAADKRGGGWHKLTLDSVVDLAAEGGDEMILALGAALERLEAAQPEKARVVEMMFFAGLTQDECAAALGVSRRTIARYWEYGRAWLYRELTADAPPATGDPD